MTNDKPPLPRNSDAWVHLRSWIGKRIGELHVELERQGVETDFIRGQIAELREIVRRVEPELPEEGTSGTYFSTGQQPT